MATFGLIPGAGGDGWYWHLVEPELRGRGHEVVTVDLPMSDESVGFDGYADVVATALDGRRDVVLVAQSMGGFTAPPVCDRRPVDLMVLVTAMVPVAGETAGEWWDNTGQGAAMSKMAEREGRGPEFDLHEHFLHDVPDDVVAELFARPEPAQADRSFTDPWPRAAWPDVPTKFVLCGDDRFFPADWMRGVVRDRLGIEPGEIAGGHLVALSNPVELAERLHSYVAM